MRLKKIIITNDSSNLLKNLVSEFNTDNKEIFLSLDNCMLYQKDKDSIYYSEIPLIDYRFYLSDSKYILETKKIKLPISKNKIKLSSVLKELVFGIKKTKGWTELITIANLDQKHTIDNLKLEHLKDYELKLTKRIGNLAIKKRKIINDINRILEKHPNIYTTKDMAKLLSISQITFYRLYKKYKDDILTDKFRVALAGKSPQLDWKQAQEISEFVKSNPNQFTMSELNELFDMDYNDVNSIFYKGIQNYNIEPLIKYVKRKIEPLFSDDIAMEMYKLVRESPGKYTLNNLGEMFNIDPAKLTSIAYFGKRKMDIPPLKEYLIMKKRGVK